MENEVTTTLCFATLVTLEEDIDGVRTEVVDIEYRYINMSNIIIILNISVQHSVISSHCYQRDDSETPSS